MKEIKIKIPDEFDCIRVYCLFVDDEGKMIKFTNHDVVDLGQDKPIITKDQDIGLYDIYG